MIDGRTFYFRERSGQWHLQVDLKPDGHLTERPIASGTTEQLGQSAIDHLTFIVQTVRDHITREACTHPGAGRFCPDCGTRVAP